MKKPNQIIIITSIILILITSVSATNTTEIYKKVGLERALENDLGINARIILEDLYYHRLDRVSEQIKSYYPNDVKGVISSNKFETEILIKNPDNVKLHDFIIKNNYASAKNYKEPVIIRFYTGDHDVLYNIIKHDDFGVSYEDVLLDGKEFMNIKSNNGYLEFESINGFSTFIFSFPTHYFSSTTISEFGYFYVSDYTNKKVKQLVIPNFDTEQSQLVNSVTGGGFTSGDLTLIDGIEFVVVNDVSDDVYVYYELESIGLNYRKDIFVLFDDWTKAKFTLDVSSIEPNKYQDLPNIELGYNDEYNFYIPFYVLKSNILMNGYNELSSPIFFTERGTNDLIPGSVIMLDEFGSGSVSTTWFDAYVIGHTNVRIISKSSNKEFDLRVVPKNIYGNTQPLISEININDDTFVPEEPEVITRTPVSIEDNSVVLRGRLDSIGVDDVDLSFEYREVGSSTWLKTPSSGVVNSVTNFVFFVDKLKSNTNYEYRARIDYDGEVKRGLIESFSTLDVISSDLPVQISSFPSINLISSYIINDLSSFFDNFDYIDVVIPNFDTSQNVLMYRPLSGSVEYNFDYLNLKYYSDYKLEISESVNDNFYLELTVVVGNEKGIITRNIPVVVGDPDFVPSGEDLLDGLVSYYKFDETSGTTAYDSHGTNDGLLSNYDLWDYNGKINTGLNLENEFVNPNIIQNYDEISLSVWIKTSHSQFNPFSIIGADQTDRSFQLRMDGTSAGIGKIRGIVFVNGNNYFTQTSNSYNDDEWYHIVFTYNKNSANIYVNGNLEVYNDQMSGNLDKQANIIIGGGIDGTTSNFYGKLDEVGIWNRALSTEEISTLYNSGNGLSYNDFDGEIDELNKINDISNIQLEQWKTTTITINDYFNNVYDYILSFDGEYINVNEQYNTDTIKITTNNQEIIIETKSELGTFPITLTTYDIYNNQETTSFNLEIVTEITDPLPTITTTLSNIIIPFNSENTRTLNNYITNYEELIIYITDLTNLINYAPLNSEIGGTITETTYQIVLDEEHDTIKFISQSTPTDFIVKIYAQNEHGTIETEYEVTIGDIPLQNEDLEEHTMYLPNSVFNLHSFDLQSIVLSDYFNNIDSFWVLNEQGNKVIDSSNYYYGGLNLNKTILGQEVINKLGLFRVYKDPSLNNVILQTFGNHYNNDLTGYNNDFNPYTPSFGFDVVTSSESYDLTYPISILSIDGLIRNNYLDDFLIDGETRSENNIYTINVNDYYTNYDTDSEGNIIGDVTFFKEILAVEGLISTSLELYTTNEGNGISLSDFTEITHPDYNYIYQDEYFIITINTVTGIIKVVDKETFELSVETEGFTAFRRFSYQVGMLRSDPVSSLTDEYFVVMDDVFDTAFFVTFPYEEPLPPIDEGLPGFFSNLFDSIFPNSSELSNTQKMSRVFITLLFILFSLIILDFNTSGEKRNLLVGLGIGLSVFMIIVFTFTGYIPIWIIIILVLSLIAFGVGKVRNNMIGNSSGG